MLHARDARLRELGSAPTESELRRVVQHDTGEGALVRHESGRGNVVGDGRMSADKVVNSRQDRMLFAPLKVDAPVLVKGLGRDGIRRNGPKTESTSRCILPLLIAVIVCRLQGGRGLRCYEFQDH